MFLLNLYLVRRPSWLLLLLTWLSAHPQQTNHRYSLRVMASPLHFLLNISQGEIPKDSHPQLQVQAQ
jgi:hypothetical protein